MEKLSSRGDQGQRLRASRDPVLLTKMNPPVIHADIVARPRLLEHLEGNVRRPLTVISAPAGYGKSTLAAQWLASSSLPGVWLSLDDGDNAPRSFLAYFVAAVRRHSGTACKTTHDLLATTELPTSSRLAEQLANELEGIRRPFILALDDYHRIVNPDIHELLNRLLEHPPRSLHLAIITRRDPPLPVMAMRARGLALEIREADLQFSAEETRSVFSSMADLALSPGNLAKIMVELEGWIVGLRMVCLALRNSEDPDAYLSGLHGGIAEFQQYLLEQVLSRQSPEIQHCLLRTSIVERFCGPLCEALCCDDESADPKLPRVGGQDFIRAVSEANLFAVNLDDRGDWLRYHHLFQDLLRQLLETRVGPVEVRDLHGRASRWFEASGLVDEALSHAMAAGDVEHAADIVEEHRVGILNEDRWPVLAGWLSRLPEEIVWQRPELLLGEAWLAYYRFRIPALSRIADRLDVLLSGDGARPAWVGELAMFRSFLCYWQGQTEEMLRQVATAQKDLPITHDLMRADSEIYFGLAHHMAGQQDVAIEAVTRRMEEQPEQQGLLPTRRVITLAFIHLLSGQLKQAAIHSRQLGELAWTSSPVYITSWSTYLLGCCHFQSGDWQEAERCFRWMAENRYIAHTATVMSSLTGLAMTLYFLGRKDQSAKVVQLLQDYALETKDPGNLAIAESARARFELLRGQTPVPSRPEGFPDAAASMATSFAFLEVPAITRCRLLIGQDSRGSLEEAIATLEGLENAAAAIHNTFHLIDLLALEAVALEKLGRPGEAANALSRALELAAPGEWVRPFTELGRTMANLLARVSNAGFQKQAERILESFVGQAASPPSTETSNKSSSADQPLIETLTHRELDVLDLLAERLYDKEIAVQLGVSISTVKTHLRNMYQKLDAGNRRQAVIKATDLGLL